jgi:hypothetical protein
MFPTLLRRSLFGVSFGLALASCSGGGSAPSAPTAGGGAQQQAEQTQQTQAVTPSSSAANVASVSLGESAKPATFAAGGDTATLGLFSSGAKQGAALSISIPAPRSQMKTQTTPSWSTPSCSTYSPPSIDITNPFPFPIVLTSQDLKYVYILILTKCNVAGNGYNVALNEIKPSVTSPTTVGDVKGVKISSSYYGITDFRERAKATYTFAPRSTSELSFVQAPVDPSTGYPYPTTQAVTFPPNTPTMLGSVPTESCTGSSPSPGCPNGSSTMTSVALTTQTTSGGSASVDCFNTKDPRFAAVPASDIALFPGVVKGACQFDTGSSTIALGTTVTFTITNPDPDTAHGLLEGPPVQVPCTQVTSGDTITATCPTTGPSGTGFTVGSDPTTEYEYFLFGNDPGTTNVYLSPSWISVAAGTASNGYTFVLPTFPSYPVTLKIDGDVNGNLSLADFNPIPACGPNNSGIDMTSVAPGTLTVNCNSGHQQQIIVSYNGGTWQYQHNGITGQNQDCDASCVAYAAIDLYDSSGKTLLQGDGPGATINGTSNALATINPIAIIDPVSGALEDPNGQTVNLPLTDTGSNATVLKVTEANINALNDTDVNFYLTQPTYGPLFGLNVYYGGSQFVTSGSPFLPVGNSNGLAHLPYGVGLNIQANQLGGTGLLFISPPEPPGSHEPPAGIVNVVIPQVGSSPAPEPSAQAVRRRRL